MRTLARTLIAIPAAGLFMATFAATSYSDPPEVVAATQIDVEIVQDDAGEHFGVLRFRLDDGRMAGSDAQIRIEVSGDDTRRSLEVIDPGNTGRGPTRVRDTLTIVHGIDQACPGGRPCEADIPLVFIGRPGRADTVTFLVAVESWDAWQDEVDPLDPPVDEEGEPLADMQVTAEWIPDGDE